MGAKKYSRQKIDYWVAEAVTLLIGTIDTAGFDATKDAIPKLHRFMPEKFFKSFPTSYARSLVYRATEQKLDKLKVLRTNPESLSPKERRRLEKFEDQRVKDFNSRADAPPTIIRKSPERTPAGYIQGETYSREQAENLIDQEGKLHGGTQVNGTDFSGHPDQAKARLSEIFEKLKERKERARERNLKAAANGGRQTDTGIMMLIRYFLPTGQDRILRKLLLFIEEESVEGED